MRAHGPTCMCHCDEELRSVGGPLSLYPLAWACFFEKKIEGDCLSLFFKIKINR
jgi:hypothetical protein